MNIRSTVDAAEKTGVNVNCLFFARYAELLERTELALVLPAGATVADAVKHVREDTPGGDQLPAVPLVARNQRHVKADTVVEDGDELAFLPPLAGG